MSTNRELFNDPLPPDVLEHLDDPDVRARWPRDLVNQYDVVLSAIKTELDEPSARRVALRIIESLSNYHGGRQYYLPRGDKLRAALRDKQIWDNFDGKPETVNSLCKEYDLTPQMIYTILRQQRALHRKRMQPELPL
jgi:Mor family transcriptional regulator